MILTGKDTIDLRVISIKEGTELGAVKDIVYSPKENKVIAFLLTSGDVLTEPNAVSFSEIKEITKKAVLVKSDSSIKPSSKVVKPASTPENKDTFMKGTEIVSDDGSVLGQEKDIRFDTVSGEVKEFVVMSGGQETTVPVTSVVTSTSSTTIIKMDGSGGSEKEQSGILGKVKVLYNNVKGGEIYMTHTVLGIFSNREAAEAAINHLETDGYNPKDISIVMKDKGEKEVLEHNTGANVAGSALSGATTGAVVGGIAGLLAGTVLPALGGFLIGGPIGAALGLTGAAATTVSGAATGALAGGLLGALTGIGVPEETARVYETRVNEGAILLAVPADDTRVAEVKEIMEEFDGQDVQVIANKDEHVAHYAGHHHTGDTQVHAHGTHRHTTEEVVA